jgi:hypothetical protein
MGKEKEMTNKLLTGMRKADNVAYTDNGAVSNRSTLSDVLDFYYHVSARRGKDNTQLFANAFAEDKVLAVKAAFYSRDVRGGQGERNSFRQVLRYLYNNQRAIFNKIVELVPIYGRWDDILKFVESVTVQNMVWNQLQNDLTSDNPSLLAKWMPSENTSSENTQKLAMQWISAFGISPRQYRKMLSSIRRKLNMPESLMSAGKFGDIDYSHVPSRAAMLYRKAFSKRDAERYVAYLEAVKTGKTTIKAATLYPYEIVEKYLSSVRHVDDTLEAQWNALPNYCKDGENKNALCIVDTSGSMSGRPMAVAISLGLYIAERNTGQFHNYFINFSHTPHLIQVKGNNVYERVHNMASTDWGGNTNFQASIDLILNTAVKNNVPQSDMPKMLYVISDMQFDMACPGVNKTNFEAMKQKFIRAGYEMPTVVFWNVNSFNNETPVTQDEKGVFLVSGCSPSIFKACINAEATNPMELMLEVLNSDRYAAVEEALN